MANSKAFAEIIESSLTEWTAQSWQWDTFPQYGSLVSVETKQRTLFGIVYRVQTGSIDPTRTPFTYQKTEEELMQEQPQIFEFLKTSFSCLTIGYQENNKISYMLAPTPPRIHTFVHNASPDLYKKFFASHQYLHLLFSAANTIATIDELLLAILRYQAQHKLLNHDHLTQFIQIFSVLTGNDYRRLKLFLGRIEQNISV